MALHKRAKGVLLCVAATVLVSPDNLLVVLIHNTETSAVTTFWKYTFASVAQWLVCLVLLDGVRRAAEQLRAAGCYAVLGALAQGAMSLQLTTAFLNTTSVKALMLFSLHVVWASLGGWLWLGDQLPPRTIILVVIGVSSAATMLLEKQGDRQDAMPLERFGNLQALGSGAAFAFNLLLSRFLSRVRPGVSVLPISAAGTTLAMLGSLAIAGGSVSISQPLAAVPLLVLDGGVLVALSLLAYAIGPQYMTATEVTLICLLEPALGPVFVYFGAGQVPSRVSMCSGCILLVSLVVHEVVGMSKANEVSPLSRDSSESLLR